MSNNPQNKADHSFHWQPKQNFSTHLIYRRFEVIKTTLQSSCDPVCLIHLEGQLDWIIPQKISESLSCDKLSSPPVVEDSASAILDVSGDQAGNQLGKPGVAKSFLRGAKIFQTMSSSFQLCPTDFSWGEKSFAGGDPSCAPLVPGQVARSVICSSKILLLRENMNKREDSKC